MDHWRPMRAEDLPEVLHIADIVHVDLPESIAVFNERLALFPAGCAMTVGGYAVAHPSRLGAPPQLDTLLGALPSDATALHVHDIALLPERQGQGLGKAALARFAALALGQGLGCLTLIAVHGTAGYWRRLGFSEGPQPDLTSYGAGAAYMVRNLHPAAGTPAPSTA